MTKEVIAFLPCRQGSERVKEKNVRPFADIAGGLTQIKLQQLIRCAGIDRIVVSTDDPKVIDIARSCAQSTEKNITILERPTHLCLSTTSMDDFISYIPSIIPEGILLWVHVTEPFADEMVYQSAVQAYQQHVEMGEYDSLLSVTPIQTFLWDKQGPLNYDPEQQKWPRSQDLPIYYEINCAVFMISIAGIVQHNDRVGQAPYLFPLEFPATVDIDTPQDFALAQSLWRAGIQDGLGGLE